MTTATQSPATCPPSAVHDQALPWFEVPEGDLVIYAGQFHRLDAMWPSGGRTLGIRLFSGGAQHDHVVFAEDYTAVRRYDTGEG